MPRSTQVPEAAFSLRCVKRCRVLSGVVLTLLRGLSSALASRVHYLHPCLQDTGNHRIRYVFPNGTIVTVAGNGTASYFGDGGPGSRATLSSPYSVWPDGTGGVFIAEVH